MGTKIEELRQLREFVGQKLREGAAEAPLREVLMREGGWSIDDLNMIFAQVKAAATQSPLVPTTPVVPPTAPTPALQGVSASAEPLAPTITTATTSVGTFSLDAPQAGSEQQAVEPSAVHDTPVSQTPPTVSPPPSAEISTVSPNPALQSPTQSPTRSRFSLLLARLPYLRRALYVFIACMVLLAAFFGYRIAQWLQPTDGGMQTSAPADSEDVSSPTEVADTQTPHFPETPLVEVPIEQDTVDEESSTDAPTTPLSETPTSNPLHVSSGLEPSVRAVSVRDTDTTRTLSPGDKVAVMWEQVNEHGEYTSFTLKHVDSDVEYGNAGGGYFATGQLETNAYVPFGVPSGTYRVRVYVRPATCFPAEFKNLIQGYQPLLASTETNWCVEGSYAVSESNDVLNIASQQ